MDEPLLENLISFLKGADNLPPFLYDVVSKENIHNFLKGTLPEITEAEKSKILRYLPKHQKEETAKLTNAVIEEIDYNLVLLTNTAQVNRYLNYAFDKLQIALRKIEFNSCNKDIQALFRDFCTLDYLERLKKDKVYAKRSLDPDEWQPPYLHFDFSANQRLAYYLLTEFLLDADFFEMEYNMVLHYIENLQVKDNSDNIKKAPKSSLACPDTFEKLFYDEKNAEPCLDILRKLDKPFLDADYNYIGKNKGIFGVWIDAMKRCSPAPLIRHVDDRCYRKLILSKINGLTLYEDASEFRKTYKRLDKQQVGLQIKYFLSQLSHQGRLGK